MVTADSTASECLFVAGSCNSGCLFKTDSCALEFPIIGDPWMFWCAIIGDSGDISFKSGASDMGCRVGKSLGSNSRLEDLPSESCSNLISLDILP